MMIGLGLSVCLGGGNGVAPPPTANMEAWFRKGVGITSAANAVSNWANQAASGAARDLAQATGAAQPTLQGDGTILFDGTSDYLAALFTLPQPVTVYLRFKQVTWTLSKRIFDGGGVNGMSFMQHDGAGPAPSGSPNLLMYAGLYTPTAASIQTIGLNTWASCALVYDGASSLEQDGANPAVTGNVGPGVPGGFTLGAIGGGSGSWSNIQVAEAIIYSVSHGAATRASVIAYLNTL